MAKNGLKPVRSTEEARELGRKGGIASGIARREKKTLRRCLEILMDMPSEERPDKTNREAAALALLQKALKGDVSAFVTLRDSIGEKPTDKKEVSGPDGSPLQIEGGVTLPESVQRLIDKVKGC